MTREDRIAEILGHWQDQRDEGTFVDAAALCAEHPELADELRLRLAALNIVEQAYAESRMFDGDAPKRLGEFEIVRELGRGGMGVVYEAVQTSMKRTVALKVLFPSVTSSRRAIERFQREARAAGRVQHTNIVPVYSLSREAGTWYYAMELVEGASLSTLIRQMRELGDEPGEEHYTLLDTLRGSDASEAPTTGPGAALRETSPTASRLGETRGSVRYHRDVALMFADVADALQAAHDEGVIHRDIKPSNLILDEKGVLKIVDFGIARIGSEASGMTITGEVLGTPIYMSPEQARARASDIDHRTDIYSLGASLYEVLTLRTPFTGTSFPDVYRQILTTQPVAPRRHSRSIPRDLETIVTKAMEKERGRRYASAGALSRDLRAFAAGFGIEARRVGPVMRALRVVKRHKVRSALIACTLVAASVAAYLGIHSGRERERLRHIEYAELCAQAHGAMARRGLQQEDATKELGIRAGRALEFLDRAIALVPERPEAWMSRAMAAGRPHSSRLSDIEAAHARGLSQRTAHLARAVVFEAAGLHAKAKAEQEAAASEAPATDAERYFEGVLEVRRGAHDRGIALLTASLDAARLPSIPRGLARYWRAYAREKKGDLAGAVEDLAKLPAEGGASYATRIHIASLWKRLGQDERAGASFDEALARARRTASADAFMDLWWACAEQRRQAWKSAVAHASQGLDEQTPWTLLIQANEALYEQELKRALTLAERALELDSGFATGYIWHAMALRRFGRRDEAVTSLERAVALAETVPGVLRLAGVGYLNLDRAERALELLDQAIALAPHDVELRKVRASALGSLQRFEEAEEALNAAARLDPLGSTVWEARGNFWHRRGQHARHVDNDLASSRAAFEEAVRCHEHSTQIRPGTGRYWGNLATALNNLERYEAAIEASEKGIAVGDASGDPNFTKAYALHGLGKHEEALVVLGEQTARGHSVAKIHMLMARILLQKATTSVFAEDQMESAPSPTLEAALHAVTKALELYVSNKAEAFGLRGKIHLNLGGPKDAIADYRRAVALEPTDGEMQYGLALVIFLNGNPKEALSILEKIRPQRAKHYKDWHLAAGCLERLGQPKKALEASLVALKLQPGEPQLVFLAAKLCDAGGDIHGALKILDEGLGHRPKAPLLHANRGMVLMRLGRSAEALKAFDWAIALGHEGPRVHARRAAALLQVEAAPQLANLQEAYQLYDKKSYLRATSSFRAALANDLIRSDVASGNHLYNAACSAALASSQAEGDEAQGLREQALAWLGEDQELRRAALEKLRHQNPPPALLARGEASYKQMREYARVKDTDLAALRGMLAFRKLFEQDEAPAGAPAGGR